MYENFYNLSEKPFSLLPDPAYFYLSPEHDMAMILLRYAVMNEQAFTVVTGEVGTGKTTLMNQLIDEIDDDTRVGLLNFTHPATTEIMPWVMMALGLEYRDKSLVELTDDFQRFLIEQYAAGGRTVLIIDEAQNIPLKGLEELRMLSNLNSGKDLLVQIILVGQPELRENLKRRELRQLQQRISVSYHLNALSATETREYIAHRLSVAGGAPHLFSQRAWTMIWEASGGIPRVINTLSDLALVYGFSRHSAGINSRIVAEVLRDRHRAGLGFDWNGFGPRSVGQAAPAVRPTESG